MGSDVLRLLVLSDANSAHTIGWIRALAARGHEIILFSFTKPVGEPYADLQNVEVQSLGLPVSVAADSEGALAKLRYIAAIAPIRRLLEAFAPDVIHAHYVTSYGTIATLAGARPRILSAWGADVYGLAHRSRVHRKIIGSVLDSADLVLSTSRIMRGQVATLTQHPVEVTPFGVDTDRFSPRESTPHPGDKLITVGLVKSLEAKYGVDYLLQSFAIVAASERSERHYRLLIVGDGSLRSKLEHLAHELGIAERVQFAGRCNYAEVHRWHQALDIAVYPSIDPSESFGVAAVESQACAVPVIVTDIGGLPEVVVDGRTGVVVPPKDAKRLAEAILALGEDPLLRQRMGALARTHVIDNYSLAACVETMERIYLRVSQSFRMHNRGVGARARP